MIRKRVSDVPDLELLRNLVFQQAGVFPSILTNEEVVQVLGYDLEEQKARGFDAETIVESKQINQQIGALLDNQPIETYLCNPVPEMSYEASGATVLCLEDIKEILENDLPIFKFKYLPFATTRGWHGLFLHPSGEVFGGERHVFCEDFVSEDLTWRYFDKNAATWTASPFEEDIVETKLTVLSSDPASFITSMLADELKELIDEFDKSFAT